MDSLAFLMQSFLSPEKEENITEGFSVTKPHHGFPSGYFKIRSRLTGKCLDVNGGDTKRGSRVVLFNCHDGLNQQWYVDSLGRIVNRLSGLALDIRRSDKTNGAAVTLWTANGGRNQQWYVDSIGRINSRLNKKSLTFDENNKGSVLPVYMWENFNSPAQRWYFERIGKSKQTVELFASHNGKRKAKTITNNRIPPSDEFTIQFWMRLNKFKKGGWKHIYHKGPQGTYPRTPGLWIYPKEPRFHVRASTTRNRNEGCDPNYRIPERKWINVAHVVSGKTVILYVNSRPVRKCTLKGYPNPNQDPLRVTINRADVRMKFFEYSNYALNNDQIRHNMKLKNPVSRAKGKIKKKAPVRSGVKIVNMSSNDSWPPGKKTSPKCDPFRGQLNQDSAWCAAIKKSLKNYLQADFDQIYNITKILTQGRSTTTQYVTRYAIFYQDPATDKWVRYGTSFSGNRDRNTIATNKIDLVTKAVRIYPLAWHKHPSMRIGFDGTVKGLGKCAQYLKRSQEGDNMEERKKYLKLYNRECRKITFEKHLKILEDQKNKYDGLYDMVHKYKSGSQNAAKMKKNLKSKIDRLNAQIRRLKLDVELAKSKKCPPKEKCLPMLTPPKPELKEKNVNDFDIRTHKDFHKYVLAKSVKPCVSKSAKRLENELKECQSRFSEKITAKHINMSGGGKTSVYGKMCNISSANGSNAESSVESGVEVEHAYASDPYSIKKHKDFKKLMKNYIHKSKCKGTRDNSSQAQCKTLDEYDIRDHKHYKLISKAVKSNGTSDIRKHPDYSKLMAKYAVRDSSTCPPTYKPCPNPKLSISKSVVDAKYIAREGKEYLLLKQVQKKYVDLLKDIKKHPNYSKLMDKYAVRDTSTCPPTYKPCKSARAEAEMRSEGTLFAKDRGDITTHPDYKKQRKLSNFDIRKHPDIVNYVHKDDIKKLRNKFVKDYAESSPEMKAMADITKHPQYEKLMTKYARKDTSTCPPTFKTCQECKKLSEYAITDHPDIHKYMLKTQVPGQLQESEEFNKQLDAAKKLIKQQKKIIQQMQQNCSEEQSVQLAQTEEMLRKQQKTIKKMMNISEHPQFQEMKQQLLNQYAFKDTSTCPPTYKKCKLHRGSEEEMKKIGDFPITDHPDIHKYMLKSQLPKFLDKECRKMFKK